MILWLLNCMLHICTPQHCKLFGYEVLPWLIGFSGWRLKKGLVSVPPFHIAVDGTRGHPRSPQHLVLLVPGTWLVCMAVSSTGGHPRSTFLPRPYFPLLWSYLWSPTHAFATFPVVPFLPSPGGVLGNGFSGGIWRVLISLHFVWCSCLMSCCQGDLSIFPLVTFHWTKSWCRQRPLVQGDQAPSLFYPVQSTNKHQVPTSTKFQPVQSTNKYQVETSGKYQQV